MLIKRACVLQLVDKLTTDEDIQDVEFDLNDVSITLCEMFTVEYIILSIKFSLLCR